MSFTFRDEAPGDEDAIFALTRDAFDGMPYADGSEPYIIDALRRDGDLTLSMVAFDEEGLAGHVAFSPLIAGDQREDWYGLGPISVRKDVQRRGLGRALINQGLERLRAIGARGCALIGDPNVYRGSGFIGDGRLSYQDLDRRFVQRIVFSGRAPAGELVFAPGFEAKPG